MLLARLQGVRPVSGGWLCLCPGHADRRPSLFVAEGRTCVLFKCYVGCLKPVVLATIDMAFRDLFYR